MKKIYFSLIFLILLLGSFLFRPLSIFAIDNKELTQEELDSYIKLSDTDRRDILNTLPQVFTEEWMDSIVRVAIPEKEAISLIIRQAVRGHMRDYLLIEGPRDVGIEIVKLGFKIGQMFLTKNISISDLISELEKLTIKESVNYLSQWLKEKEIKIATGNLDFSYDNFQNKKEKHQFQYIILYSPETDDTGEMVIKIFSSEQMSAPGSFGSFAGGWGTAWNYTNEYAQGKKIAPFILTIRGEMERARVGYWQSEITHNYSWKYQPEIELEFPRTVPYFDFREKGFFEKLGDQIKEFFGRIGDLFSGASLTGVPDIEKNQDGTIDLSADSALGKFIANILEQFRAFRSLLGQAQLDALENQVQDTMTEDDLLALLEKIESLQAQLAAMGEKINLLQAGVGTSSDTTELNPAQNQQTKQNILINEVCAGINNSQNEFIEIYNPNNTPIDISDDSFQLQLVSSSDNVTKKKITWTKNIIPAKGYFLLIGGELIINNEKIQGDAVFSSQLTSVSGIILSDKEGNILDKVSWGSPEKSPPQSAVEKRGKILQKGLETNNSLERSNYIDTNNNSADFSLNESPSPANSLGEEFIYTIQGQGGNGNGDDGDGDGEEEDGQSENSDQQQNISGGGSSNRPICSQDRLDSPANSPIIINEIAWMGSEAGYINEWIELKNISDSAINLENWQLLDKAENIRITFSANHAIPAHGFYLLERSDDEVVPSVSADVIYTGALANSNESLRLFNSNCDLIDEVMASPDWSAGDNDTKQTMERGDDLLWHDYSGQGSDGIMGTPRAENSEIIINNQGENNEDEEDDGDDGDDEDEEDDGDDEDDEDDGSGDDSVSAIGLVISEVRAAGIEEFIEIYNPLEQEISLVGFYFSYFSAGRDWNNPFLNKEFPTSTPVIGAKEYFLIGLGDYLEEESDWKPNQTNLSSDNGAVALFSCDPSQATTTQMAIDCKIDAVGWGEPLVFETQAATSSSDKSLARKLSPDENGYLRYIDTDDNYNDFEEQESTPKQQNQSAYSDLDNDGIIDEYDPVTEISSDIILPAGEYIFKDLVIIQGFGLFAGSDILLEGFKGVKITADNININEDAGIFADNNGYASDQGPGVSIASQTGASHGGVGGRNEGDPKLFIYGDLEFPIEPGSGALGNPEVPRLSPYRPGGAGGGAIVLDVQGELLNNGFISANGEDGLPHVTSYASTGAGSGGSVYITTSVLSGTGIVRVNGGGSSRSSGAGGGGRIAVYYDTNNFAGNIQAFGGEDANNILNGGPGTVFMSQGEIGNLVIDNNAREGVTALSNDSYVFGDIIVSGGANFYLPDQLSCANFDVQNSAVLIAIDNATINISNAFNLNQSQLIGENQKIVTIEGNEITLVESEILANVFVQTNSLTIDSGSAILSTGLGYVFEEGPGAGINAYGGSYGGLGGRNYESSGFGQPYGIEEMPDDFGSGGGNGNEVRKGESGGGKIIIISVGEIVIDGAISSNGNNGLPHITSYPASGAGSGGTIYLSASVVNGVGTVSANGGSASSIGGGGGGGRIAIYGNIGGFTGIIEALGGKNSTNAYYDGEDGTVFLGSGDFEPN
ncbi:lamin tail domain-containing protein [Patescibacteria group bacterium]|nr:lamin tail domain-containing protein [Patescibacteria group bacterium]MBU4162351.1 lamin tail domain-containing protein [Patescibacteria group bacterium]